MQNGNLDIAGIKTLVDGFVSNTIRQRSAFLDIEKTIREAMAVISAAPLSADQVATLAAFIAKNETHLGLTGLQMEMKAKANVAAIETSARTITGSQGRFAQRQIERMRDQLDAVQGDITRLRDELLVMRKRLLEPDGWDA